MAKYKAVLNSINAKQTDKETAKIPIGEWYLNVSFKPTQKYVNDFAEWQPVETETDLTFWKRYPLTHDRTFVNKSGETKSMYQMSREMLEKDLGFTGNDSELDGLVGLEREIVTDKNERGYEEIKWINGPRTRKPLVEETKKESFASIFNR